MAEAGFAAPDQSQRDDYSKQSGWFYKYKSETLKEFNTEQS